MKRKTKDILFSLALFFLVSLVFYSAHFNRPGDIGRIHLKNLQAEEFHLSKNDYVEDFNFVYHTLKQYYPFFEVNKRQYGIDWLKNKENYEAYISLSKNDADFFDRMNTVLLDLHNGHTQLIDENSGIATYLGYYSFPKSDWRHDLSKIYEKDRVRRRYKIHNDSVKRIVKAYFSENTEAELAETGGNLIVESLVTNELAYMKVNRMLSTSLNDAAVKQDRALLDKYLDPLKDYSNLIIDIRGNGGGDSRYWSDFLLPQIINRPYETKNYLFIKNGKLSRKIIKQEHFSSNVDSFLEDTALLKDTKTLLRDFDSYLVTDQVVKPNGDSIHFKGKIYLLVDEGVYSSSEMLASFCKETKLATLVGAKTGGDGIGFDPMQIDLPKTGFVLRFPLNMGVTESGSINEFDKTSPDIEVKADSMDSFSRLTDQKIIQAVMDDAEISIH